MKYIPRLTFFILLGFTGMSCSKDKKEIYKYKEVYETENLKITKISENTYIHTSFLQHDDLSKIPCNGMILTGGNEAFILDTPTDNTSTKELIHWIQNTLQLSIKGILPTHFHKDCLGGLQEFDDKGIPSYASFHTIRLANENNYPLPKIGFHDSLMLQIEDKMILARHFGEGHTRDNVVVYFPSEDILFGGCLIKELGAQKGFLGDANLDEWSSTVESVKKNFPDAKIVVPGHGSFGNTELLDYTIKLFNTRHFGEKLFSTPN